MAMSNEAQVREAAYLLWESEGRPVDQAERHWLQALSLVTPKNAKPAKARAPAKKLRRAA
jgi:Protein of unknown function (DUF2934)